MEEKTNTYCCQSCSYRYCASTGVNKHVRIFTDESTHPLFGPLERLRLGQRRSGRSEDIQERSSQSDAAQRPSRAGFASARQRGRRQLHLVQIGVRHRPTSPSQVLQSRRRQIERKSQSGRHAHRFHARAQQTRR